MTITKTAGQQTLPATQAHTLLAEESFRQELLAAATEAGMPPDKAEQYARKCLHEMAAAPDEGWFGPAAKIGRFIFSRSYDPNLDINKEALEELRKLSEDNLLLFLWSHKSHMDSFAFLVSLYENQFKPIPLVFAGINMNFLGFGTLARKVGSIFLRREFQEDPIYKLVFRHYIDYLIRNRLPLTWSIEGTRSRTGKLSPPKLGIMNWVLEACEREQMRNVMFVPVSIAFDRIAEIDDYVALQQGLPKRKESLRWFLNYVFGTKEPNGKIYLRYARPVSIADVEDGHSEEQEGGASLANRVAFEVCTRIEQATPIKSADVLTMVLLGANGRALTVGEIFQQSLEITGLSRARGLPLATGFKLENEQQVGAALLSMRSSKLVKEFDEGPSPVYFIPEEGQLAAAYYRNTITHYFLAAALGEVALAMGADDVKITGTEALRERVEQVRDLFKFEFFFRPKDEFFEEVIEETSRRYPQWRDGSVSLLKQLRRQPPQFAHAILRSIAEAFYVVATGLASRGDLPVTDDKLFIDGLMDLGQEMLLRRQISGESSLSRDLYANGLKLARHRELMDPRSDDLAQRRLGFVSETYSLLHAINLLQDCYDRAWFTPR